MLLLDSCTKHTQASYDPNAVAAVLAQFPYHVDSLLAMNELYRSMGEAQVRFVVFCLLFVCALLFFRLCCLFCLFVLLVLFCLCV